MDGKSSSSVVDVDDESILKSIFKNQFLDSWKNDPGFVLYMSELSSYDINKLNHEPQHLEDEKANILDQIRELAFNNYRTFIKAAECSKDIFQDFEIIENKLENIMNRLPTLSGEATGFMQTAQKICADRRSNSMTLSLHTQILEVLEIPQLMDTCVRNQYYDEALELMFYVKRLEKKHIVAEIPVLRSVINDVKKSTQFLLTHLLSQLRSNLQLAAILRIIGYIRRLDCFNETELRLKFLQARNSWLDGLLDAIPDDDAYTHITRTIEACRVHFFDIVTQYRAIFSSESDAPYLYIPLQNGNDALKDAPRETSVFHSWLVYRMSKFLETLKKDLARGASKRLDSILGQCMYFGLSLSRIGADFRGLLLPIFSEAAQFNFKQSLDEATQQFAHDMMAFPPISTSMTYNRGLGNSDLTALSSGDLQPPSTLQEFPSLATYLNNILEAFNELRLCCPVSLSKAIPDTLTESLNCVVAIVLEYYHMEEAAFTNNERNVFVRYCTAFCDDLVSHINECLTLLLCPTKVRKMFCTSTAQFGSKAEELLNTHAIVKPLKNVTSISTNST